MAPVTTTPQVARVGTARRIKVLTEWPSHAALFELSAPFKGHTFVVASGLDDEWAHECMLFAADLEGDVADADFKDGLHTVSGTDGWADLFQAIGYLVTF